MTDCLPDRSRVHRHPTPSTAGIGPPGTSRGSGSVQSRLICRRTLIDRQIPPLARATNDAFAWRSPTCEMVGFGVAARVQVAAGPDALWRIAETARALLAGVVDEEGSGPGPFVVGALPFSPEGKAELIVPRLTVWDDGVTAYAVTVTSVSDTVFSDATLSNAALSSATLSNSVWSDAGNAREGADGVVLPPPRAVLPWPATRLTVPREMDKHAWSAAVDRVVNAICAGDGPDALHKVVLARQIYLDAETALPAETLLQRLASHSHAPYIYGWRGMVGASPELLVRRCDTEVVSEPTGGTIARDPDPRLDEARQAALLASIKDQAEHRYVADAVANSLSDIGEVTRVAVRVVRFPTVAHLVTTVHAQLFSPAPCALDLVARLSPTPAVAGVPRVEALQHIQALEPFDRGHYGGPVGWMDRKGDGEWAIAIRGAQVVGTRLTVTAGAGIVEASEPGAEWQETEAKLQAMLALLDDPSPCEPSSCELSPIARPRNL